MGMIGNSITMVFTTVAKFVDEGQSGYHRKSGTVTALSQLLTMM
jgi:hypothetical protein